MATTYTPLRQDNGVDSWIVEETDGDGQVTSKYMVYEDPNKKSSIRDMERLSPEEIATFKGLIGVTGGGGSVTLTSGEGIDVVDNGDGSYTINSTTGGPGGPHVLTKPILGRQYSTRIMGVSSFTYATMAANTIILNPFIPANTLTISSLKINVPNATAGALVRMLVYSDSNGVPSSKLIESTDLDASKSGDKTYNASFTFRAGTTYWLGVHTNIALSLIIIEPGNSIPISSNSFYGAFYTTNTSANYRSAPDTLSSANLAQGYAPSIILTAL
tara:strand:- start:4344 stop:5162 length:819 start_codon:yes stop_codon:yes gene_type:complete